MVLPCPSCGARLLAKTTDRPPRLICASCGRLQPQTNLPPLLGLLDRHGLGLLALLLLVAMPLVLLALSPWIDQPPQRRGAAASGTSRPSLESSRWDPRSGLMRRQR